MTAGLEAGDIITSVNDVEISSLDQLIETINSYVGQEITMTIERDGQVETVALTPRENPPEGEGAVGIGLSNPLKPAPMTESIGNAFRTTGYIIRETVLLPIRLIRGSVDPALARPVGYKGIYDIYSQAVAMDQESDLVTAEPLPVYTLSIIANISLALGITNLLPIPALDGGRILFTLPELIFKKRIPQRWENVVNTVFFLLLIVLMVFITILDFTNPVVIP
jgi:regulator of sigma E protease